MKVKIESFFWEMKLGKREMLGLWDEITKKTLVVYEP
jgi:hypothetical protein